MMLLRLVVLRCATLVVLCFGFAAQAQAPAGAPGPAKSGAPAAPLGTSTDLLKREMQVAADLRCLVCQNQSIAESNADLALDLRRQIRELMAAGKSDREIIDYMTARYGDFVLYRPPFKASTLLLWFGPALLLLLGAAIAWRVIRARRRSEAEVALSDADRARAAQLLGETKP
jgi:cytochrome c-type biogenesis protein CcmH